MRDDHDLYDLADDQPARPRAEAPAAPVVPADRTAGPKALKRAEPLEYRRHSIDENSGPSDEQLDRAKNIYLPLILIGGGIIVRFGYVLMFTRSRPGQTAFDALKYTALEILVMTGLMLVGVLIVSRIRKIGLGSFPVAIMKLCAVAIAPQAVVILAGPLIHFIPFGTSIIEFAAFFALLGALFDLDQADTWYCWLVMAAIAVWFELGYLWWPWLQKSL